MNLKIKNFEFSSRLLVGTGKFPNQEIISSICDSSESQIITMALRRIDFKNPGQNILDFIPKNMTLLPNTSGATNAKEAIRIAKLARACGCGDFIKIEVIPDQKYLMPDNFETIKATEILSKEGFIVLPYMSPDLMSAKHLVNAGASAIMPLGSAIGSNRGLKTKELIKMIISEITEVPIIVDAGIGKPSDAALAMEIGADAVLINTAIASSPNPINMAKAFKLAVEAGRLAYESKLAEKSWFANASSPLEGIIGGF